MFAVMYRRNKKRELILKIWAGESSAILMFVCVFRRHPVGLMLYKSRHLLKIIREKHLEPSEVLLVDSGLKEVKDASLNGYHAVHVAGTEGFDFDSLEIAPVDDIRL